MERGGSIMEYNLELGKGNIIDFVLKESIDVIVNSAKTTLEGGSGVDEAIHKAAGPKLLEECKSIFSNPNCCNQGEVKSTESYNINCKKIYHTVGVKLKNEKEYTQTDVSIMKKCYRNCLEKCLKEGFKSIAFPVIGSGKYNWGIEVALRIAISEIHNFLIDNKDNLKIYLVIFQGEKDDYKLAKKIYNEHEKLYKIGHRSIALNAYTSQRAYIRDVLKARRAGDLLLFLVRLCLVIYPYFYPITFYFRNKSGVKSWNCRRAFIDMVVICKVAIMLLFVITPFSCKNDWIVYYFQPFIVIYLLCETILYNSTLLFLKDIQNPSASNTRSILLFLFNMVEIQIGFAFLYKIFNSLTGASLAIDYIHHSFTNNGEVTGVGDIISIFQVCINFYMLSILLSLFISGLKSRNYLFEDNK